MNTLVYNMVRSGLITMPYPEKDCSGSIVVVTGANSGIGREASRHFVRLGAAKVILGCRNLDKGEEAKKDIEETTGKKDVVEVWQLNMASFDSVREFAARVDKLDRLDILVDNASRLIFTRQMIEGHESTLTVNVISTFLLTMLLLPIMRRTATKFNIVPHIVVVSSDAATASPLPERESENIFKALDAKTDVLEPEAVDASGKGHIVINCLHPGFCGTQLFRRFPFPFNLIFKLFTALFARTAEMGSRTLLVAAFAGDDTHGRFMFDAKLHEPPQIMQGDEGEKLTQRVWDELVEILEGIVPGVTNNI
ncbi:hypothetical protein CEP52_003197 [Fusarium oligoseptatum]|uniref:Uncharacterized protein n=1 Tax=Fusarium oligoseptatum TaxID=2604345 RepID=A0A428U9I9_9HYPO|nr:hypothetical protein CEP52_003197 [Fusarium oligoseptatum]